MRLMTLCSNDVYLGKIQPRLRAVGADLHHVCRVRVYLTDMSHASGFIRAHGEIFKGELIPC